MSEQWSHPITRVFAEEIKNSHGSPTIKVTVSAGAVSGSFSVPSGASTGVHEAHELRDPEPEQARYGTGADGRGVKIAIKKVNEVIAPALISHDVLDQKGIDRIMLDLDGTLNKDNLGGNSMVGVSIATAKAAAQAQNLETFQYLRNLAEIKPSRRVPYLFMNLLEGGKHTDSGLPFQEYLIVPDTENLSEAVLLGERIVNTLKANILLIV